MAQLLRDVGHDAVHTSELGLAEAEDSALLAFAAEQNRVVVTGDTDFGALVALLRVRAPSVILFRGRSTPGAPDQAEMILVHLDDLAADLDEGAVVVITDDRIRVRRPPLLHDT